MGFFESIGNLQQSLQQKLAYGTVGETQRQVRERKEAFGVECFDLLRATSQKSRMKMFLHQIDVSGAEAYVECERSIGAMERERASKDDKLAELILIVDGATSKGGKEAGQGLMEKLENELAAMDDRIQARKEQFGIDFFDAIVFPNGKDSRRMVVNKAKGRALQECIEDAKHDVWVLENTRQLQAEGRLAEC